MAILARIARKKARTISQTLLETLIWLLLLIYFTLIVYVGLETWKIEPVFATVTQIEDASGNQHYRSQQTLGDQAGNPWQVIFFKQIYANGVTSLNLKLLGCSSSVSVAHPQPLQITTETGKILSASDLFLDQAPIPSAGMYDLKGIFEALPKEDLLLTLPLTNRKLLQIKIPQSVVLEWQEVAGKSSSSILPPQQPPNLDLFC